MQLVGKLKHSLICGKCLTKLLQLLKPVTYQQNLKLLQGEKKDFFSLSVYSCLYKKLKSCLSIHLRFI